MGCAEQRQTQQTLHSGEVVCTYATPVARNQKVNGSLQ